MPPEVWLDRIKRLDALRDFVARHIDRALEKQEREYNKNKRDIVFFAKLAPKYEGPYKIMEVKSPTVYVLESVSGDSKRIAKTHVSEIKRFVPPKSAKNH